MADKKPKLPEYLSPKCVFSYPKLLIPDMGGPGFPKPDGEFSVKLIMTADEAATVRKQAEPQAAEYIKQALAAAEEAVAKAKPSDKPKKMKALEAMQTAADEGFKMSAEDQIGTDGNPTGNVVVTFKQKAIIKFPGKDGAEVKRAIRIPLFDAKGNAIQTHDANGRLLENAIRIYGGTTGKVRYCIIPAYIAAGGKFWASLRPVAVQIINLVSTASTKTAGEYGFDSEDGFDANDAPSMPAVEGSDAGAASY